ncbi:MAG: N-acetyl-gamma-glutamyl-phosphate reductase [Deltaproteobacteria bacterium]|nr:N-acetyl-gamma-glutamyl-phosphate reductase [Deltaproteobacteria bacterium]
MLPSAPPPPPAPPAPHAGARVSVVVVGASGYTGAELLRYLTAHPRADVRAVYGHSKAGLPLGEVFPSLAHSALRLSAFDPDAAAEEASVAFLALPHGASQEAARALRERGVRVVDLSADHRFSDPAEYARVYGVPHAHPALLAEAVYGLPELFRDEVRGAGLVACPGCYPTSVALGAAPALRAGLARDAEVIADCKSGVSGAGRAPKEASLLSERAESMQGYQTLAHRHAPEMEATLGRVLAAAAGEDARGQRARGVARVHFAPHLAPMSRGILSTLYLRLRAGVTAEEVRAAYEASYAGEPLVTLLPPEQSPTTLAVRGTSRCHLGLTVKGDLLVVHSAIDNLGKGAAGQAVQCFNLMVGLDESLGLTAAGLYP